MAQDIDFTTCTMRDVIVRSYLMHPSFFADALESIAKEHLNYSSLTRDQRSADIARKMHNECRWLARDMRLDRLDVSALSLSEVVQAFSVAARLNCLSPALKADIASRDA